MSDDEQMDLSPPSSFKADDYDLPNGVKKSVLSEGQGWEKPRDRYEVKVNIQGKHGDSVFDTNASEGEPRVYTVGSGLPCKGVDASFKHMKKGEKAKLTVEARLAFGAEGLPDKGVPADAEVWPYFFPFAALFSSLARR
jgi:FKBP-type peptidyl-prolyl cis-trans isomerase